MVSHMDYSTRPSVHEASNFWFFPNSKKTKKKPVLVILPDSKIGRKGKNPVTGNYYLIRSISPEKKRCLAGIVQLDRAERKNYQHTSSRNYEHLCGSIATVTTDTHATLHSTQRKRSRFIISLSKPIRATGVGEALTQAALRQRNGRWMQTAVTFRSCTLDRSDNFMRSAIGTDVTVVVNKDAVHL